MRALIIGESWGVNEAQFKHALVGATGHELVRLLNQVDLAPELPGRFPPPERMIEYWLALRNTHDIGVTNVFNQRPPGNEVELFFGGTGLRTLPALTKGKYILPEHLHHVERLWQEIRALKPNLIIALGNCAAWATLGKTKISELRGYVHYSLPHLAAPDSNLPYIKVIPSYHPAAILRQWSNRTILLKDLEKCAREIEWPEIRRVPRWITGHDTTPGAPRLTIQEIRQWLNRPASEYAIDIESGYALFSALELQKMTSQMRHILSSQISMVSFARNERDALVIPFMERNTIDLSYWKKRDDEVEAWRLTKRAIERPVPKVFQNSLYDIARFAEHGLYVKQCRDDPMLRHHAMFPEMLKGLGFLGSLYLNEIQWKAAYSNREVLKRDD